MSDSGDSLEKRLEQFHEKSQDGDWTSLFLLARMRAKADGIGIVEALTQELKLRL